MRLILISAISVATLWAPPAREPEIGLRQLSASGSLPELRWPDFSPYRIPVANFYEPAGFAPAWTREGEPTSQARAVIRVLQSARAKGLDPEDYDGSRWATRLARLRPTNGKPSEGDIARFDLALTVSLMRYISDTHIGKVNPQLVCFAYNVESKKCDFADVLRQRLVNSSEVAKVLESLEPPFPGYWRAQKALQAYIRLAAEDDGELLPATRKPVDLGKPYAAVARLDRLLRRLGDLPGNAPKVSNPQIYEGMLVDAVKRFQARHGIDPDGRIGKDTLKQLNTPLIRRVRQLDLVLERWRWIPEEFSRPTVVINIPEFRLQAFDASHRAELEMKVVVGKAYRRQTPVFTNQMTHVIFRPYWNVPLSIQRGELAPKLAKDGAYLGKNSYEIVNGRQEVVERDVATEAMLPLLRSGKLSLRQVPGGKNALGQIKFVFPNGFNVYLHGTPAKALFSRSRRDFSHGCIRVEKPEELAAWVLRDRPEWTMERIREAENGAKPLQVNLANPIPVLIFYGTAVARESGEVCFFDDIYKHDATLEELLDKGYPYSGWKPTSAARGRRPRE